MTLPRIRLVHDDGEQILDHDNRQLTRRRRKPRRNTSGVRLSPPPRHDGDATVIVSTGEDEPF